MNKKKVKVMLTGALGTCLVSFLLLVSCGQKAPTSPYSFSFDPYSSNAKQPAPAPHSLFGEVFKVFCQSEFSVKFETSEDLAKQVDIILPCDSSQLTFLPNSVSNFVSISGSVVRGFSFNEGLVTFLTFRPDGLDFLRPLEFDYRTNSKEGDKIRFYWYDETNGVWKLEETKEVTNSRVLFNIKHFSTYKIVDGSTSNGNQKF